MFFKETVVDDNYKYILCEYILTFSVCVCVCLNYIAHCSVFYLKKVVNENYKYIFYI